MVKVKISVDAMAGKVSYELEGEPQEILDLPEDLLNELNRKITAFYGTLEGAAVEVRAPTAEATLIGLADISSGRIILSPSARKLTIKETLGLILLSSKMLGKEEVSSKDIQEILVENGIPYNLTSALARLSEMTREGHLIRLGRSTYKLSVFGEGWIKEELAKKAER